MSFPSSPYIGQLHVDPLGDQYRYTGSSWVINDAGGGSISGNGSANVIAKWTGSGVLGDSIISEVNGLVSIGSSSNPGNFTIYGNDQLTVNMGVSQAGETKVNSGRDIGDYPLREGTFFRDFIPFESVYTRQDHGIMDSSCYLPIVGQFQDRTGNLHFDRNYSGEGFVIIGNGREGSIYNRAKFYFDTVDAQKVVIESVGYWGHEYICADDIDGSFCVTVPSYYDVGQSSYPLAFINNTPFQLEVAYWVTYTNDGDPYTYLGWLYD